MTGMCECGLDRRRRFHRKNCPVAPGDQFRFTGAEFAERTGLAEALAGALAEANRAYVRGLLAQREPAMAGAIEHALGLPCGPRCRAVPPPVMTAGFRFPPEPEPGTGEPR